MYKKIAAVVIPVVLLGIIALLVAGFLGVQALKKRSVSAETYQSIQVGDSESHVIGSISAEAEISKPQVYGRYVPASAKLPKRADCRFYAARAATDDGNLQAYRLCFRNERLLRKDTIVRADSMQ